MQGLTTLFVSSLMVATALVPAWAEDLPQPLKARLLIDPHPHSFTVGLELTNTTENDVQVVFGRGSAGLTNVPRLYLRRGSQTLTVTPPVYARPPKRSMRPDTLILPPGQPTLYGEFTMGWPKGFPRKWLGSREEWTIAAHIEFPSVGVVQTSPQRLATLEEIHEYIRMLIPADGKINGIGHSALVRIGPPAAHELTKHVLLEPETFFADAFERTKGKPLTWLYGTQANAAFVLGEIGDRQAIPTLEALAKRDDCPGFWKRAIQENVQRIRKTGQASSKENQDKPRP